MQVGERLQARRLRLDDFGAVLQFLREQHDHVVERDDPDKGSLFVGDREPADMLIAQLLERVVDGHVVRTDDQVVTDEIFSRLLVEIRHLFEGQRDLAIGQDPDGFVVFHHDDGTDVFFSHLRGDCRNRCIRLCGDDVALDDVVYRDRTEGCLSTAHLLGWLRARAPLSTHLLHLSLLADHRGLLAATLRGLLVRLHAGLTLWGMLDLLTRALWLPVPGLRWLALSLPRLSLHRRLLTLHLRLLALHRRLLALRRRLLALLGR